jgi:hypothetical protein
MCRSVHLLVPVYFCLPKICPGRRQFEEMAVVPVPETAVRKNCGTVLREDNVRLAGQSAIMQPKSEAKAVETFPNYHFRLGIRASDARHHATADGSRDNVSHRP